MYIFVKEIYTERRLVFLYISLCKEIYKERWLVHTFVKEIYEERCLVSLYISLCKEIYKEIYKERCPVYLESCCRLDSHAQAPLARDTARATWKGKYFYRYMLYFKIYLSKREISCVYREMVQIWLRCSSAAGSWHCTHNLWESVFLYISLNKAKSFGAMIRVRAINSQSPATIIF